MSKRNWEPVLFAAAAILVGLFAALRAFTPFYRLQSKVGSWEQAWAIVAQAQAHWTGAVLTRLLLGGLLLWLALRWRRHGRIKSYIALAVAALAIHFADLGLWLFASFG